MTDSTRRWLSGPITVTAAQEEHYRRGLPGVARRANTGGVRIDTVTIGGPITLTGNTGSQQVVVAAGLVSTWWLRRRARRLGAVTVPDEADRQHHQRAAGLLGQHPYLSYHWLHRQHGRIPARATDRRLTLRVPWRTLPLPRRLDPRPPGDYQPYARSHPGAPGPAGDGRQETYG